MDWGKIKRIAAHIQFQAQNIRLRVPHPWTTGEDIELALRNLEGFISEIRKEIEDDGNTASRSAKK